MKIRVKFEKQGNLRFIGHLDVMRYFQKMNRRAGLDVKYSMGFSPHQEMSFGSPLGLGLLSKAEYVDIEFNTVPPMEELIDRMNAVSVPELRILSAALLPDKAKNAMSLLAAADYELSFRAEKTKEEYDAFFERLFGFLEKEEIIVLRETKKHTENADIKPMIKKAERRGNMLFLQVDAGSKSNLRPELLLKAFYEDRGEVFDPFAFNIERTELYGEEEGELKDFLSYGEKW